MHATDGSAGQADGPALQGLCLIQVKPRGRWCFPLGLQSGTMGQSLFEGGLHLLTFNTILVLLGVCCVGLLVGFSWREQRWGPWVMLVFVVSLLSLMSYAILNLLL
ncbi:hypothetical protein Ga0061062_102220 [Comamonas thiooxydans]|nr:hypothetical protein Ga0061062_102220 [Comamonas thiooxydans]